MDLKPYPKYKDSGISWVGEIPKGWEVHRLKFLLFTLESGGREEGGGSMLDKGIFSLGGEHINWNGTLNLDNPKLVSEEYYKKMKQGKLKNNDVLLLKDGATIGKTAILRKKEFKKMAVNEHVFLMRANKRIDPKLLYYLICSDYGFKQIKLTEVGSAQGGINQDFISKIYFIVPADKHEQTAIANFLDKKIAQIDVLIEKDKKLIELLKERRTALINHAVTKGLDPNAKLKDSGIPWIGEIPEGWEIGRLKNKTLIKYGASLSELERIEGNISVFGSNGEVGKHNKSITQGKTLIIGRKGSYGKLNLSENSCFPIDTTYFIDNTCTKCDIKYLYYLLSQLELDEISRDSAVPGLSREVVYNKVIPYVLKPEQTAIANYLDKATVRIDQTIQKVEQKINLLEEYKKSLIHNVVTGKIDVREVKP